MNLAPMQDLALIDGRIRCFFSKDSKHVGILMKGSLYHIFRVKDGSKLCVLQDSMFEPVLDITSGGHQIIIGIIDTMSRKYMAWSMEALIHLSNRLLYLFPSDFTKEELIDREKKAGKLGAKHKILGGPFPAFYP